MLSIMVTPATLRRDDNAPPLAGVVPGSPDDSASELHSEVEVSREEFDAGIMTITCMDVSGAVLVAVGGGDGNAGAGATPHVPTAPVAAAPHALVASPRRVATSLSVREVLAARAAPMLVQSLVRTITLPLALPIATASRTSVTGMPIKAAKARRSAHSAPTGERRSTRLPGSISVGAPWGMKANTLRVRRTLG